MWRRWWWWWCDTLTTGGRWGWRARSRATCVSLQSCGAFHRPFLRPKRTPDHLERNKGTLGAVLQKTETSTRYQAQALWKALPLQTSLCFFVTEIVRKKLGFFAPLLVLYVIIMLIITVPKIFSLLVSIFINIFGIFIFPKYSFEWFNMFSFYLTWKYLLLY